MKMRIKLRLNTRFSVPVEKRLKKIMIYPPEDGKYAFKGQILDNEAMKKLKQYFKTLLTLHNDMTRRLQSALPMVRWRVG